MNIMTLIDQEKERQISTLQMIASENFVSNDVRKACGSVLLNKYAEGYPKKRYYNGCDVVDEIENYGIETAKKLFNCNFANIQPHSGSSANMAVYTALLKPNDKILGMSLDCGGHLTHGFKASVTGKIFQGISYGVNKNDFLIDYNEIEEIAKREMPRIIVAGFSAYSRIIDWKKFKDIANSVGAYLMCDIAHVAGLVAKEEYPSPIEYADVVTTTNHKTLRGARGGMILCNDENIAKKINSSVFPGNQGGPLMNQIAGKTIALQEALTDDFGFYIKQVRKNANTLAERFINNKINVLTNGTDNHIVLLDLRGNKISGRDVANTLDSCGIICNKNSIPFDTTSPTETSGIRLGTPAITTLGLTQLHMIKIADIISEIIYKMEHNQTLEIQEFKTEIGNITKDFKLKGFLD